MSPQATQTIALEGVKHFAYHGFYPEEQLWGTTFVCDISVEMPFRPQASDQNFAHTINYEILNKIIAEEMQRTQKLIETVARNILNRVLESSTHLHSVTIWLRKLHPPLENRVEQSSIRIHYVL